MSRLWIQMTLAFVATVMAISIGLVVVAQLTNYAPPRPRPHHAVFSNDGLQRQLISFYDNGMSLEDSIDILLLVDTVTQGVGWTYRLEDPNGNVIFDNLGQGDRRETIELGTYGSLTILRRSPGFTPVDLQDENDPLSIFHIETISSLIVLVGLVIGVIVAIVISLYLTSPLRRITDGVAQFSKRNFHYRIKPTGSAEFQQVAKAMNQMAAELEESDRLKKNLIADISHELRTPLSVLEGSTRAIIDDVYPLEKSEIMHIYDQTRLLSHLVNDLHELTLADAKRLPLKKASTDLPELIQSVVDIFKPVAETTGLHVSIKYEGNFQPIQVDAFRMKQVLHNLLVNSLHHTPPDGQIGVQAIGSDETITLHVHDTGIGIPAEDVDYVFERFYRADKSRNRERGGTGLGLAISKAIIEAHDGTISVESSVHDPQGTTFTIVLPLN